MSFEFRMSTKRRGTPGAKSSPFTRKLSITISTMTPVAVGASGSRGASRLGWASTGCSVSISTSHLGGYPRFPIVEPSPVFAASAEQASPLRLGDSPLPNVPQRCRLVHDGGLLSRDPHLPH